MKSGSLAGTTATFCGLVAIAFWGALALLGTMTRQIPAFQLLFLCFSISAVLLLVKRLVKGEPLLSKPELSGKQWLAGIFGLFGYHFGFFVALKLAPAIEVTLINYLWPLLLALMLAVASGRRARLLSAMTGSMIGFCGIIVLMYDKLLQINWFGGEWQQYLGYLIALGCAFIWSGYSFFLSHSSGKTEDMGWLSLAVAGLSFIAHLLLEQGVWTLQWQQWLGVLLLGLGPVGGAFYLWDYALKHGNQGLLASMSFTTPLISACALALFGISSWSVNIMIALAMVLLGAVIANSKPRETSPLTNPE